MAKIIYLSPQKLARQFKSWFWSSPLAEFSLTENQGDHPAIESQKSDPETEENKHFQISTEDMQTIHFSLQHFQKYLKAKGQSQKADEVAQLYDRISQFIQYRQESNE
ncbi:MAG: hypothetical protein HC913_11600 [Microscillaceae bacterium]|nr:hypothetical protein [Microscillaceae bacterium]